MINVMWQTLLQSIRVSQDVQLERLHGALLDGYISDVRPSTIDNRPLNVTFGFVLTQIIDVDERNQMLTTSVWLQQQWQDSQLVWDPKDYGNIMYTHLPHERIWLPDIVLYNNGDVHYPKGVLSTDIFVKYDGTVTWSAAGILTSSCVMNVRYYPFDEQKCVLKFASWAYDGLKIDVLLESPKVSIDSYKKSSEWVMLGITAQKDKYYFSCCPNAPFPYLEFEVHIRRRPMFYIFNLILPCIMIAMVALLGFFMPCDSGEKVTLGITTLLSLTVFLMLVAESMPPTSDSLPLIGMFYGVTICIVSIGTAMTVVTLNVHHKGKGGRPVPQYVQTIAFKYVAVVFRVQIDSKLDYKFCPSSSEDSESELTEEEVSTTLVFKPTTSNDIVNQNHRLSANAGSCISLPTEALTVKESEDCYHQMAYWQSRRERQRQRHEGQPDANANTMPTAEMLERQFAVALRQMQRVMADSDRRMGKTEHREAVVHEWRLVAIVIDRLLLTLFVIGTFTTSVAILYQHGQIDTRAEQAIFDALLNQSLIS